MSVIPQESVRKEKKQKKPSPREQIIEGQPHEHIRQLLLDGEEVIRVARIHPAIYWKGGAVLLLGLLLLFPATNLGLFLIFVATLVLCAAYLTQHFLMLALTTKRVLIRYGIIKLEVVQIHHRKIESVELGWTILGQIWGYASVMITGTGSRVSVIPYIADAPQFRKELEQILLDIEENGAAPVAPAAPPPADTPPV
jgi:membrane protein implicated in regulation of membrane protease activity